MLLPLCIAGKNLASTKHFNVNIIVIHYTSHCRLGRGALHCLGRGVAGRKGPAPGGRKRRTRQIVASRPQDRSHWYRCCRGHRTVADHCDRLPAQDVPISRCHAVGDHDGYMARSWSVLCGPAIASTLV